MARTNEEVARLLDELATLTELDEGDPNSFRVRAYQNAERAVKGLGEDVSGMSATELAKVKGIGKSIAAKIREYVEEGRIAKLDGLRDEHPKEKLKLLQVPGVGPKTVRLLETELGITSLEALSAGLEDGSVAGLEGLGEKTAENMRRGIETLGLTSKDTRIPIATALPVAERIVAALAEVDGVVDAAYAGSLRRFREDIGDVDILVATEDAGVVHETFLALDEVERTIGSGETKTSVITRDEVQVDLRVVPPESFGAALLYFTGSKAHNIRLRQRAIDRGWTLNEYALAVADEDGHAGEVVARATEDEIYEALELAPMPPEVREDDGELELAEAFDLPDLVRVEDLRGDLHDHTDRSGDGHDPLETLVDAAVARGLEYLAITDHAEDLRINGVSRETMLTQREELRSLEERRGDIALLHGAELNIGPDGGLDYDEDFLAGFDWLVASVHSHFDRSVEEQTARVIAAIRQPSVTAIGHLTGRLIGKRQGIALDLEAVLDAAAETGTAIEINAALQRLDASVEVIREGERRGCTFVISTDAHAAADLERARFGAAQARRARLARDRVANTWPHQRFRDWIDAVRSA
ncbi:MAG: DNA polymerase/3'-5' exonuclease PolX [Nitriliruptoraceae bacterium]